MDTQPLEKIATLSYSHKSALKKGNILTVSDLLLSSTSDIVRRCRVAHSDAQDIVDIVFDELQGPQLLSLDGIDLPKDEVITTGDPLIDKAFGGGVKTRKIWEIVGESAAGKTQLALQLALCTQLPRNLGGVSGAACFLSTSWALPTNRLVEIIEHHPLLSPALCGLADIHFMKTPTIPLLLHVLSHTFPEFQEGLHSKPYAKPVKLVIIDAITELFHSDEQVSSSTLAERAKNLNDVATLLHMLANKHGLAIVVLNEVLDSIDRPAPPNAQPHEVRYSDQARLFSRADTIPGERSKEAALGLVWANQVNARIMLTRTERVRTLDDTEYRPTKRRRTGDESTDDSPSLAPSEPTRIRHLSVIFSSTAPPSSLDYIVTQGGVVAFEDSDVPLSTLQLSSSPIKRSDIPPSTALAEVCPLDLPFGDIEGPSSDLPSSLPSSGYVNLLQAGSKAVESEAQSLPTTLDAENGPQDDGDEWEAYWKDTDLGSDVYSQMDLGASSSS